MKGAIVLVLMALTISMVYGGSLYDAKENAKTAVKSKYEEAKTLNGKVKKDISNEKEKKEEDSLNQAQVTMDKKKEEANTQLDKNVLEVTRTAIAKGKPLQTIDCIENTFLEGKQMLNYTYSSLKVALDNVAKNKLKKLDFLELECDLISNGLKELIDQALKKIDDIKSGYDAVVADAGKKVDSAQRLLHDIEVSVIKPSLVTEYLNIKKRTETEYKQTSDSLLKKLQKCVA